MRKKVIFPVILLFSIFTFSLFASAEWDNQSYYEFNSQTYNRGGFLSRQIIYRTDGTAQVEDFYNIGEDSISLNKDYYGKTIITQDILYRGNNFAGFSKTDSHGLSYFPVPIRDATVEISFNNAINFEPSGEIIEPTRIYATAYWANSNGSVYSYRVMPDSSQFNRRFIDEQSDRYTLFTNYNTFSFYLTSRTTEQERNGAKYLCYFRVQLVFDNGIQDWFSSSNSYVINPGFRFHGICDVKDTNTVISDFLSFSNGEIDTFPSALRSLRTYIHEHTVQYESPVLNDIVNIILSWQGVLLLVYVAFFIILICILLRL